MNQYCYIPTNDQLQNICRRKCIGRIASKSKDALKSLLQVTFQCDQTMRNFASMWKFLTVQVILISQNVEPTLCKSVFIIEIIFRVANGQVLKNKLTIWSRQQQRVTFNSISVAEDLWNQHMMMISALETFFITLVTIERLKADSHNLRLTHGAAADGCISAEIENFSIFTHCTLLPQPHTSECSLSK